jgi:hypothetical protein
MKAASPRGGGPPDAYSPEPSPLVFADPEVTAGSAQGRAATPGPQNPAPSSTNDVSTIAQPAQPAIKSDLPPGWA